MTENESTLRPMRSELNYLSVPDGSTMLMQGDTAVIVGVYGPVEGKMQKMHFDRANIDATFGSVKGPSSINDKLMELYIRDVCEAAVIVSLHPSASICINVQEMQDSGGLLACVLNASCLALLHSSLALKFTFASVCCMIDGESEKFILDPNETQVKNARAVFTCTFDSIEKDLISINTSGRFLEKELLEAVDKCREGSECVFNFYRDIVTKYAKRI